MQKILQALPGQTVPPAYRLPANPRRPAERPALSDPTSDLLTLGYHKMSGFGADQRAVAVPGSPGEPGKASPMRGGGRMVKRMRRCDPGKTVSV
jgi:hypothetical protein